jgi:hypothetical protein
VKVTPLAEANGREFEETQELLSMHLLPHILKQTFQYNSRALCFLANKFKFILRIYRLSKSLT